MAVTSPRLASFSGKTHRLTPSRIEGPVRAQRRGAVVLVKLPGRPFPVSLEEADRIGRGEEAKVHENAQEERNTTGENDKE